MWVEVRYSVPAVSVLRGLLRNRFALLLLLIAAWGTAPAGLMPAVALGPVMPASGPLEEEAPADERDDSTDATGKIAPVERTRSHDTFPSPTRPVRVSIFSASRPTRLFTSQPADALRNGLGTFYRC